MAPDRMPIELNPVVIRSADPGQSELSYRALGIEFMRERHGNGPEHLAGRIGNLVFEICPRGSRAGTEKVRLGFLVESVAATIQLAEGAGGTVVSPPQNSDWGMRAVIADPDGHRIELTQP